MEMQSRLRACKIIGGGTDAFSRMRDAFDADLVEEFLKALRDSDFYIRYIYSQGGCYQLYKILKVLWPEAEPYALGKGKDMVHVATRISCLLWDIYGIVYDGDDDFHPMTEEELEIAETWSFAANHDLYLGECPNCETPITIDRKKLINKKQDYETSDDYTAADRD